MGYRCCAACSHSASGTRVPARSCWRATASAKKPLYYVVLPGGLYFASELKCLRAAGVPLEEDRDALRLYFQFGYIPDPLSAFRGVRKLMPGCWLEYGMDGGVRAGPLLAHAGAPAGRG